jgi:hypothetical protein
MRREKGSAAATTRTTAAATTRITAAEAVRATAAVATAAATATTAADPMGDDKGREWFRGWCVVPDYEAASGAASTVR